MATTPATVTVPTKSPFLSKTNITGALLALFGFLGLIGKLPEGFDASTTVNTIVLVGGTLVVVFRSFFSKSVPTSSV